MDNPVIVTVPLVYADDDAACFDICTAVDLFVPSKSYVNVSTGLRAKIPKGWKMCIVSRSGMTDKHQFIVLNAPAQIDSNYRKEIAILMYNHGPTDLSFKAGSRVAQGYWDIVHRLPTTVGEVVDDTNRGGLGSTGVI